MLSEQLNTAEIKKSPWPAILGGIAILGSAFCFYLTTIVVRLSAAHVHIEPAYFTFSRFLLGFVVVLGMMKGFGLRLRPRRYHLLLGRTIANCAAVFFFYKSVTVTSVAEANILNMTYPLFITLFSWFLFKDQRDLLAVATVLVAFVGIWLVLSPGTVGLKLSNLWGLASGVSASVAILYLNVSRQEHDINTVLFFLFGGGALLTFLVFHNSIFVPTLKEFYFLFACAASGILGQYLITLGFRYVTAVEGSIISSSRILMAAFLGPFLLTDPPLTISGWVGALLIFMANSFLAIRKINQ
jgi:drug/metabolite transporter (DMT)-like permease